MHKSVVGLGDSTIVIHCHDIWSTSYRDDDGTFYYRDSSRHGI